MTEPPYVVVQRVLPATPDVVYQEWLDPDALGEWMCPRPARPVKIDIDPRVGGRLHIEIEEGQSTFEVTGEYLALDPSRLLAFTWSCSTWPDPYLVSTVTVTLSPHGAADTQMTIEHRGLAGDQRSRHEAGWELIAVQLDRRLAARD